MLKLNSSAASAAVNTLLLPCSVLLVYFCSYVRHSNKVKRINGMLLVQYFPIKLRVLLKKLLCCCDYVNLEYKATGLA